MALDSLHDLLLEQLRDLHSAETQLVKALPKLVEKITTPTLREAVNAHYGETQGHVTRLDRIFNGLAEKATGEKCKGMEGLIDECDDVAGEHGSDYVRDAGIIASAQRVEHYEIAAYGCAISFARLLGHQDIVTLLEETLAEEKAADEKLNAIAEEEVNQQALAGATTTAHGKY
jgi:ferritin-like metal-binding protein YciE